MTDKKYAIQKKRVRKFLDKWQHTLGLNSWRMSYEYDRSYCERNAKVAAEIHSSWQYKQAHIILFMPRLEEIDDDLEVEEMMVHELCHALLQPVAGDTENKTEAEVEKIEFATTTITQAIMWAYEAGKEEKSE